VAEYCTIAQVESVMPQWPQTTWPAELDAQLILEGIDSTINVVLANKGGLAVPFVSDGSNGENEFADLLRQICIHGGAMLVLKALFPDSSGPGETPVWIMHRDIYLENMKGLKDGSLLPQAVLDDTDFVEPTTVNTLYSDASVRADQGSHSRAAFYRKQSDLF